MRAVNLLPVRDRVRGPASVPERSSQIVLGVLGGLVVAVLAVVLTQNQITDRTHEIAQAKQEQQSAEARSAKLGAFGQFAQVKQTRVASVSQLAQSRFDYERLVRELALVLPADVWITEAAASTTGSPDGSTSSTAAPASGAAAAPTGPSVKLTGCAKTQSKVAETMVRLHNLHRAEDVTLDDSTRPTDAAAAPGSGSSSTTAAAGGDCGARYVFNATVTFSPDTGDDSGDKTPTKLGGGS